MCNAGSSHSNVEGIIISNGRFDGRQTTSGVIRDGSQGSNTFANRWGYGVDAGGKRFNRAYCKWRRLSVTTVSRAVLPAPHYWYCNALML